MMPNYIAASGIARGTLSASDAIDRYCAIRERLPSASHPTTTIQVDNLEDLTRDIDLFVLDGFGVLNVGNSAVPGAADRVKALREAGCTVVVLTNGATQPTERTVAKYEAWDMLFDRQAVVSSRDALIEGLKQPEYRELVWGIAGTPLAAIEQLPIRCHLLGDDDVHYEQSTGFILLSSIEWNEARQARLLNALQQRERPVLVGNPDLVAPHLDGLSLEPGWFAHELSDQLGIKPVFYGKPFLNAFEAVSKRFPDFDAQRIAMVGDSPHTDILGGAVAGWKTVLIKDHGLCKAEKLESVLARTGIRPDYVASTT